MLAGLADGSVDIVGTHALIQEGRGLNRSLRAVVIDETAPVRRRERRAALRSPGRTVPDVLVMTATPIPRTAAATVYGDLDTTVLDRLPPGQVPIRHHLGAQPDQEDSAWQLVREQVAAGNRAYVVCPLVEDSPKLEVASAERTLERLAADELAGLSIGLLAG